MGNLKAFFVAMVLLLSGSAIMAGPSEDHPVVFPSKGKDLLVVKAGKDLVGAKVEIFSESGELIATQITQKRKMYIDFSSAHIGQYTVKLTKGDKVKELNFNKK